MNTPAVGRPYMPGYGTLPAGEGSGLLSWRWVEERLRGSRNYWLSTTSPDGTPHVMPVWAVWWQDELWFSSSNASRKARNLRSRPDCCVATENPVEPVVLRGSARLVTDRSSLEGMLAEENSKYDTDYGIDMVDPASNSVFALEARWVFALDSEDFTGSPTRFEFPND